MNTVSILKEAYGYDVPIFLSQIRIGGKTKEAIRKDLSRAVKKGEIDRYDDGIYYFSRLVPTLNRKSTVSYEDIITKKFIRDDYGIDGLDINTYGYYSGYTFQNQIGISTQVPATEEITTNNTSCNRIYHCNGMRTILRKPPIKITAQNYKALQFFEMFNWLSEWEYEDNKELLFKYYKKNLILDDFKYSKYFKGKCLMRFYKDMIDYEITRR